MLIDPATDKTMIEALRARSRPRPWAQILSALMTLADRKVELVHHSERAWASATFSGARHNVRLSFTGAEAVEAGEAFIDALPDHEFAITRQLVADAAIVFAQHTALPLPCLVVEAELLVLEEN